MMAIKIKAIEKKTVGIHKETPIQITCYNHNGDIVCRVASTCGDRATSLTHYEGCVHPEKQVSVMPKQDLSHRFLPISARNLYLCIELQGKSC